MEQSYNEIDIGRLGENIIANELLAASFLVIKKRNMTLPSSVIKKAMTRPPI